jgi:hypothetical protein
VRLQRFWQRVTEGLELSQLWSQFETETRTSYRLYSRDVQAKTPEGLTRRGHRLHVIKEFFWAVLEKLSPARRVLLLVALIMLLIPSGSFSYRGSGHEVHGLEFDFHFWAALLLFLLLILEIADRVVMKRDLQIAREIQTWLLPGAPPQIPGISVAYATRPANTVAGDYYDVFPRPGKTGDDNRVVFAVADVAGKSIPAANAYGHVPGQPQNAFHRPGCPARTGGQHEQVRLLQQPGRPALHHGIFCGIRRSPAQLRIHQRRA